MSFRVQHLDHVGSLISTHEPVGGSLSYSFRAGQPGDISYQLPLSDPAIGRDSFAPYRTDWRLQYQPNSGGSWQSINAGIHTPVNIKNDQDAVNVGGKDWAHWLEQPVWFAYYNYNWSDVGATYATRKRDVVKADHSLSTPGIYDVIWALAFVPPVSQSQIITKLISNTKRGTDYVDIQPIYTGNAGVSLLESTAYLIMFQDTTTVLQHINNIAALDDPYGFDWTMNWNKRMEFFGPRKERRESPTPIWTFRKEDILEPSIFELDWTNSGPLGTHIVGLSIGSVALWWHKRDPQSVDKFREWLKLEHIGDQYIKGPDMRYGVDGLDYIHPQKDIKIVVRPEGLTDGFKNHIGDVARIKWDFPPYHEVNAYYWINEQTYNGDPAGNWKLTLGLQQIYD